MNMLISLYNIYLKINAIYNLDIKNECKKLKYEKNTKTKTK